MASEKRQVHFIFFPAMSHGHMIPMIDMARLFASRGVKATVVTTPANVTRISKYIHRADVNILTFKYASEEAGLPEGCEHLDDIPPHLWHNLPMASQKMQEPIAQILRDHRPDCLVADMFYTWATDVAGRYNIPRLVFHGTSFFSLCLVTSISSYQLSKTVSSDSEHFGIPNLPDVIKMTRTELPDFTTNEESDTGKLFKAALESELKSYGVVVNSFYELEPAYVEHLRKEHGRKAWHIGPLSLCIKDVEEKSNRGKVATIDEHECLKWLNSKEHNSVIYISFGSSVYFSPSQLREIASALEACGHQFIWVVRSQKSSEEEPEGLLPEGFEKRTEGKGLIIRGWAPQVSILEHQAIGAFMNHSGWNSVLESITAGVPMVTWPMVADNFVIEKLVTEILKIGVSVGVKRLDGIKGDSIKSEAIEKALNKIMAGEEAEEMRKRGKTLAELSKRAVEEGSSYVQLDAFIEEIALYRQR
uniref:UDP-glycosyltransferase n=1 Tax=Polygala tenuifolia TaxID=355332 RepID=A0A4P2X5R9_9FABA|nr:UDP-glycosyltransferase [Polygala tenuifolia]